MHVAGNRRYLRPPARTARQGSPHGSAGAIAAVLDDDRVERSHQAVSQLLRCARYKLAQAQPHTIRPAPSLHGDSLSRLAALRAHLHHVSPPVHGSHHGPPLGHQTTAGQSGSLGTCLRRVPAHPTEQAPPAQVGHGSAPSRNRRRRRAGSGARCAGSGACRRASTVGYPHPPRP